MAEPNPKRSRLKNIPKPFYGWVIVAVAFLIGFTEAGVFQNILSVFMKPMIDEFHWSRSLVTAAITLGSIAGGLVSPFVGPLLDRYGPRMASFWGILVLSAGMVSLAFLSRIWQLYVFFGLGRMIAVGGLSLVISVAVSNWFIQRRGRAMGIATLGSRAGTATFPPLVQFIIQSYGWRAAWACLGIVVFLLSAIPSLLFLKRRPEDIGLWPDGIPPDNLVGGENGRTENSGIEPLFEELEPNWTREQALKTSSFWLLNLMHCLVLFSGAGINFHLFPFLTDQGFTPQSAVLVLSAIAVSSGVGSLIMGFFAEKFETRKLLTINFIICGLVFISIFWLASGSGIFFFALLFGTLRGGLMPLLPLIWAEFYGRLSLGTVFSLAGPIRLTANALGPIFAALCFDSIGNYILPFVVFTSLFYFSAFLSFMVRPPRCPA
ncbi:MAG: MFS transporter [Deltaproteobacteria bacterium]|nr:MFS transporter [Deltaproteobacteria bacterium]